eukprot:6193671-Pleurochrysis_carterae.AAC.8
MGSVDRPPPLRACAPPPPLSLSPSSLLSTFMSACSLPCCSCSALLVSSSALSTLVLRFATSYTMLTTWSRAGQRTTDPYRFTYEGHEATVFQFP